MRLLKKDKKIPGEDAQAKRTLALIHVYRTEWNSDQQLIIVLNMIVK